MSRHPVADACPDAELVAQLLEDRLDAPARAAVEQHLAHCTLCLDVVAAVVEASAEAAAIEPSVEIRSTSGRTSERRVLRGTIAAGLAFVVTAAIAYAGVQLALRGMAGVLAARATIAAGDPIDIGTLRIALAPSAGTVDIALDRIAIGDAATGRSAADALEISLGLAPLVRGDVRVDRLRLVRPVLHVRLPADGGGSDPPSARDVARVTTLATLAPVDVTGGTLIVERQALPPIRIDAVEGTITPGADAVTVALHGKIGAGELTVSGTAGLDAATTLDLGLRARGVDAAALALLAPGGPVTNASDVALRIAGPAASPRVTAGATMPLSR